LDRLFDYLVPEEASADAQPGCRVRLRFAGRLTDGFIVERVAGSDHSGKLAFIERVVSPESVLSPEVYRLARTVADRCVGTVSDVLRLAVPPRRAAVEAEPLAAPPENPPAPDAETWLRYRNGPAFLTALRQHRAPRAVWTALPGETWPQRMAEAAAAAMSAGQGVLIVLPDYREVARVDAALAQQLGPGKHVTLSADLGPTTRYRRFLAARRGAVRCVVGTRAAAFAPVENLGLVMLWDDGDDLHVEPRAPYCHARDVLLSRVTDGVAVLVGGFARTSEAQQLVRLGWAHELVGDPATVRRASPRITALGEDAQQERDAAADRARLPSVAWQAARDALATGAPVLVQVPRRGYVPSLACRSCRSPARCSQCSGPLGFPGGGQLPSCRWCGHPATDWRCDACGGTALRGSVIGARRTAEELGRAFPTVPVKTSGRDAVLATVSDEPSLVIATPGAEPVAEGSGYGAALLLDGWALLSRPELRAAQEALRRWMNAAALVKDAASGGRVVTMADGGLPVVQALLRWSSPWFAERELIERIELGFPPAVRMAKLTGLSGPLGEFANQLELPPTAELLGPVPTDEFGATEAGPGHPDQGQREQILIRIPRSDTVALTSALRAMRAQWSARKAPDAVKVEIDPYTIG
jgi:primosomal protein N' (replication factor Y)